MSVISSIPNVDQMQRDIMAEPPWPKGWPPHQLLCCHCGEPVHDGQATVHHDRLWCAACEAERTKECGS